MRAAETWPSSAVVYDLTTGQRVDVSGVWEAPITRALALSVPAVLRGVSLVATTVAGLPLIRYGADGARADLGFLEQPEAGRPRFATFTDLGMDLILEGVAYLYVRERDGRAPAFGGCAYIAPDRVAVEAADHRNPQRVTIDGDPVNPADVIGFHGWHDGILNHGSRIIRTALALEAAARRYADTPLPSVVLVNTSGYDLTDTEISDLIRAYKAGRNQEGVGYVNAGVEIKPIGWDASQLQLVEARQYTATQVANLVGVPAHVIAGAAAQGGGNLTYQNTTQENRVLIDYGLKPLARALETRLSLSDVAGAAWANQVTPRGHRVRVDLDALLRGNPTERADLYAALIPLGVLTVDEARALEDLAPGGPADA